MKIILLITLANLLIAPIAQASTCNSQIEKFDFMQTSPQKFYGGTVEEVRSAYKKLTDKIGNPSIYGRTTVFYVASDFSTFSQSYCDTEKCRGLDILEGLQKCSSSNNKACYPIAVIFKSNLYCLLEPALKYNSGDKPFEPFK
ncbi:hypothetical protein AB4Y96_01735 [Phyllobacterium sp. TAF24]|jgi:hypothetical protein|uniref:hypothetical protein n=1 Tax=unclassified Phyllobacterium TaxID=2638441 RepID=UPI00088D7142|nr:hypothetical protein [Phyllobacterium sp. OV277]SDP55822.1 hypothetical protein SAMN05443582_1068 [Phyllobacterium sp. OV277]